MDPRPDPLRPIPAEAFEDPAWDPLFDFLEEIDRTYPDQPATA